MRKTSPSNRIWVLVVAVLALAGGLFAAIGTSTHSYAAQPHIPWFAVTALFVLAEVFIINFPFRREALTLSLSEIPLVIGLFFLSPAQLVASQLIGSTVALVAHRRQEPKKWLYNLGHFAIEALVASYLFRAIAHPGGTLTAREILASVLATAVAMTLSIAFVMFAIAVAGGGVSFKKLARYLTMGGIGGVTNTSLGLMGVVFLRIDMKLVWLLAVPAAAIFAAYRGYSSHRRQNEVLTDLSDATRTVQRTLKVEPAMRTVLERARAMFYSEVALITFFPQDPGEPALEARVGPESDGETLEMVSLDPTEGVWARVAAEGRGLLLSKPIENPRLRSYFATRGLKDAMVAPLWGRDGVIGTILVGNRSGNFETFKAEDLTFFEAFVNHIGVTLENVRLVARLQESVGTLTERHRLKDEFLGMFSHELRNPLMSILTNIDVMRDEGLDAAERARHLGIMSDQAEQLRSLVEDLLMDARLSGGTIEPVFGRVRVADLVDRVITSCRPWAQRHVIAAKLDDGLPEILSDYDLLQRVLSNLVSNAAKNSPDGSRITISAHRDGDTVAILVADEGVGIPEELHEQIFERFVRFERAKGTSASGLGLGLSICRRLSDAMGARVQVVRSRPGYGSEFGLIVPIRRRESLPEPIAPNNVVQFDHIRNAG